MSPRTPAGAAPDIVERIELAFPDLVGDFEVLERRLEFDGRTVADFLARSQGRVLLVNVVDGTGDDTTLRALDALAFARTQRDIVAAAFSADGAVGTAPEALCLRVVLVATTGFSAVQLGRLERLHDDCLWLLRKRELRTKRGSHTRLEPLDVSDGLAPLRRVDLPEWAQGEPHRAFLAQVAPDGLELVLDLLGRIRRIDSALEWRREGGCVIALLDEVDLCRFDWLDGHLELSLGNDELPLPVRDDDAVDLALDAILRVYLERLGNAPAAPLAAPPASAPSEALAGAAAPSPETVSKEQAARAKPGPAELEVLEEDDAELAQVDLHPMAAGPLLTREEIEAFHEAFQDE
jgi:hypothetical protein